MKRICLLFICHTVFSACTSHSELQYARNVVRTLSSPEFKGRGYAGRGDSIAAEYLRSEFRRIGLSPLGSDYYQRFTLDVNTFPDRVSLSIGGKSLRPAEEFFVDCSSPSLSGTFPVSMINRSALADRTALAHAIDGMKDRIVVIDDRESNDSIRSAVKRFVRRYQSGDSIPECRALAFVSSSNYAWSVAREQSKLPVIILMDPAFTHAKEMSVDIHARLVRDYPTQNIAGFVRGTSSPDTFLVVTAHYDHLGMMGGEAYFPGANDNASGVALMLTMARHFAKHPHRFSILFIAFAAEEAGIVGAKYFVKNPLVPIDNIRFLVNLDLAGTGDDGIRVINSNIYKEEFDRICKINEKQHFMPRIHERSPANISDHFPFYERGVPCFYIHTMGGLNWYHNPMDNFEQLTMLRFDEYRMLMAQFLESF